MYISDKQLAARFAVTRPTIWRWVKYDVAFPKPIILSRGCTRWKQAEVETWEKSRPSAH